jgi:small subunit ribosomal protein S7
MARRREAKKRIILPDAVYNEVLVSKFVNSSMKDGKKELAEKYFYKALDLIERKYKSISDQFKGGLGVFKEAVENVKPLLEVKSRRVGGANYQIPIEVKSYRRQALAIRWLISFSRKRNGNNIAEKFAAEFADAAQKKGASIKRKEEMHKTAEANKAFAHYRW